MPLVSCLLLSVIKMGLGKSNQTHFILHIGWGKGSRTPIHGVRVRCPTIERSPIFSSEFGVGSSEFKI